MSAHEHEKMAAAASRFLGKSSDDVTAVEARVLTEAVAKRALSRNTNDDFEGELTLGQRMADRVAAFGGSWAFLISFGAVLVGWIGLNLLLAGAALDPFPFIFLNLILSMVAAVQAPVIMMSQNRQAAKDRLVANHDYEVNLKAEIEIMALHEKFDQMRNSELANLITQQQAQIALMQSMILELAAPKPAV